MPIQTGQKMLWQIIRSSLLLLIAIVVGLVLSSNVSSVAQDETATPDATQAVDLALQGVSSNDEWTPYIQDFDGVEMVLVPTGCFDMGSEDGVRNERPVAEFCFDAPFWIDRYEVSNAQFAQFGGVAANSSNSTDANLPRERITWFEARAFCELRETRLPTEAEWEYAARGPDELEYPWGNEFVAENVVYGNNSNNQTAHVGSRPAGASWVGAMDMSGNVWEWTSSLYDAYPYDAADGREADSGNRTDVLRVLRGGSWYYQDSFTRAAIRYNNNPTDRGDSVGFRCAHS